MMPRSFEDYLDDRRMRIASWLEDRNAAEAATAVCESWIEDLLHRGLTLHSRHDLAALPTDMLLADRLSAAKFDGLALAWKWQIEDAEGKEPAEAALIGHALAAASGRAYAVHGPGKLDWVGHFVASINSLLWEEFANFAAKKFRDNPDLLEKFIDFLSGIIAMAHDAPDTVTEIPPRCGSMASVVEQFARTRMSFQVVWEEDQWAILFRSSDAFEILRRADAGRFVVMIDQLPHPTLVKQCLSSKALLASPEDVLSLLRLANSAIDAEGCWHRCGMAAILLLQLASEQLLLLWADEDDAEDLNKDIAHFSDGVREVLDVLFARPDGVELAWCWLENLLRQIPRVPAVNRSAPRKLMVNRIGILVHALGSRLEPRRAQDAWITEAEPLARQFRAVAVLSVTAFTSMAGGLDVGVVAKSLLKPNGFDLTRASELIHLPGAPLRTIPGDALARIPDAASWFISTWSALRFERERAWRSINPALKQRGFNPCVYVTSGPSVPDEFKGHLNKGRGVGNPAEIMGVWGLGAIESLVIDTQAQYEDRSRMWFAVERTFREARLVEPRLGRDFWSKAIARLFWWWPQVFTEVNDQADSEGAASFDPAGLSRALVPYAEISGDFMAVIVSLQQAGLSTSMLDDAVNRTRHDLLHMIRRFVAVTRRLNDCRVWNPDWVAALQRIEGELTSMRT
ncbi:hypothetical protein [Acidithiobacillus thiooxidans]|uniref:Uncharacterized protein n=1 Tax=Acidithiobacillus thiooxidans TaxID=930 RepID=A0A1C2J5U0_ACITH|nr:hypothetical protein [Acidithiobacillus thiooxidans]OCX71343.1 hypothetical protein A6M23_11995 [Acidithiobacillus thiooxidans]OCX83588.1 hypothetical protein A6P08_10255 [Acidithiobacillus thiooxidans]